MTQVEKLKYELATASSELHANFITLSSKLEVMQSRWCSKWPEGNDHGPHHVDRVLEILAQLIGADPLKSNKLSALELFLAMTGVVGHDIGVIGGRKDHAKESAERIRQLAEQNNFVLQAQWTHILEQVVICHSSSAEIRDVCGNELVIGGFEVRPRLIAGLVRLADELDEDYRRAEGWLEKQAKIPPTSIPFWRFSQCVLGVDPGQPGHPIKMHVKIELADLNLPDGALPTESFFEFFARKIAKINRERYRVTEFLGASFARKSLVVSVSPGFGLGDWTKAREFHFTDDMGVSDIAEIEAAKEFIRQFPEFAPGKPSRAPEAPPYSEPRTENLLPTEVPSTRLPSFAENGSDIPPVRNAKQFTAKGSGELPRNLAFKEDPQANTQNLALDYLERLEQSTNELEGFVAHQLPWVKSPLSDLFIQPSAYLRMLRADVVHAAPPLLNYLGSKEFFRDPDTVLRLAREGLLPASLANDLRVVLGLLRELERDATHIHLHSREPLLSSLRQLLSILPTNALAHVLEDKEFDAFEPLLLKKGDPLAQPLADFENELDKRAKATKKANSTKAKGKKPSKAERVDERRWSAIRDRRSRFVETFKRTFSSQTESSEELSWLIIECAKFLLAQKSGNNKHDADAAAAVDAVAMVKKALAAFDLEFRSRYVVLFSGLPTNPIQIQDPAPLEDLSNMSAFLESRIQLNDEMFLTISRDAVSFLKLLPRTFIEGEIGIGKSTLLKQIGGHLAWTAKRNPNVAVPVLMRLATFTPPNGLGVGQALTEVAYKEAGLPKSAVNLSWLLDGFDEIENTETREKLLGWLGEVTSRPNQVVMSSRSTALPSYVPGFVRLHVKEFDQIQVESFLKRFPWRDPAKGGQLAAVLAKNSDLAALSRVPLLLTLMVILAERDGVERLPGRRDILYREIVDLFLGEWERAKGLRRGTRSVEHERQETLLGKAAYWLYRSKKIVFSENDFIVACQQESPGKTMGSVALEKLFRELVSDCIIMKVSLTMYRFFHLSVQEYLVADELHHDVSSERVHDFLLRHLSDPSWWLAPLDFYVGIKRNIGALINGMRMPAQENKKDTLARVLTKWVAIADETDPERLRPSEGVAAIILRAGIYPQHADRWRNLAGRAGRNS